MSAKTIVDLIAKKESVLLKQSVIDTLDKGLACTIIAKKLLKSFPTLASLGDMPMYRVMPSKTGETLILMPALYNTDKGLKACLPDATATISETLKVDSFYLSLEDDCYVIFTDGNECFIKCSLFVNKDKLKIFVEEYEFILGEYNLESIPEDLLEIFRERPKIVQTLSNLTLKEAYTIKKLDDYYVNKEKNFKTLLVNVSDDKGNIIENILTNSEIAKKGKLERSFKIIRSETIKEKVKDAKGKKIEQSKTTHFIQWLDETPLIIED
jgi:hypothetical protein